MKNKLNFLWIAFFSIQAFFANNSNFLKSFVQAYQFDVSGKYGHEYHPYLLKNTSSSLKALESELAKICGSAPKRFVIMGYEGNCIPNYFPVPGDFTGGIINDEFFESILFDWSAKANNRFGLMSGYLLKNSNTLSKKIFTHVGEKEQFIFNSKAQFFQEDAFGNFYSKMREYLPYCNYDLKTDDWKALIKKMICFWQHLYHTEAKTGDYKVSGTQDILFTLENAKHILRESVYGVKRFFTGADITYPINPTTLCNQKATLNAQKFVEIFSQELKPVDNKNTMYVFKSFVDGVGKSTLLGNIKNYINHKNDFKNYDAVDNSSSLFADVFEFSDQVFIADLPAQMSHFTFKPDGCVFVDVAALNWSNDQVSKVKNFYNQNKDVIFSQYKNQLLKIADKVNRELFFDDCFNDSLSPINLFLRNVVLLKKSQTNNWIPFEFDGDFYLADKSSVSQSLKILKPIGEARSEGLKNAQAEQMLFFQGATFPPKYDLFLKDLIDQAKKNKIERVVFVDFLSMYSRSSRENIRVNYLLQNLACLDKNFDPNLTFYSNFNSNGHLLSTLKESLQVRKKFEKNLFYESVLRLMLFNVLNDSAGLKTNQSSSISDKDIVAKCLLFINSRSSELSDLEQLIKNKFNYEVEHLNKVYGKNKEYKNIYDVNLRNIEKLSNHLISYFSKEIICGDLQKYFLGLGNFEKNKLFFPNESQGELIKNISFDSANCDCEVVFKIHPKNKSPLILNRFFQILRLSWYKLIFNLAFAKKIESKLVLKELVYKDNFLIFKQGTDGFYYLLKKKMFKSDLKNQQDKDDFLNFFKGESQSEQSDKNNLLKIFDQAKDFSTGIFGWGFNPNHKNYKFCDFEEIVNKIINPLVSQNLNETLNIKDFCQNYTSQSDNSYFYFDPYEHACHMAKKAQTEIDKLGNKKKSELEIEKIKKKFKFLFIQKDQEQAIAKLAQLFVSIETVARDINSWVVVDNNAKDFHAGVKAFEKIILPEYFKLICKEPIQTEPIKLFYT